jgi:flagellar biosynthesis regulator FlaF
VALCRALKQISKLVKPELFDRRLWTIFMSAAESNENSQPLEVRQNIANIAVFVMQQTIDMQMDPDPAKLKPLIDIDCNLAAGLSAAAEAHGTDGVGVFAGIDTPCYEIPPRA